MCHNYILSQATPQHFATTLALGAGVEGECQDLDAVEMKENFSNVKV